MTAGLFVPEIRFAHSHYVTNAGVNQPWGRSPAFSFDFDVPEPVPGGPLHIINGPFYRNSRTRAGERDRWALEHGLPGRADFAAGRRDLGGRRAVRQRRPQAGLAVRPQ